MFIALSIFALMVIPFCTVAQLNVGGAYKETIWNIIFYIALLLFGVMYCLVVRAENTREIVYIFCGYELRIFCHKFGDFFVSQL